MYLQLINGGKMSGLLVSVRELFPLLLHCKYLIVLILAVEGNHVDRLYFQETHRVKGVEHFLISLGTKHHLFGFVAQADHIDSLLA